MYIKDVQSDKFYSVVDFSRLTVTFVVSHIFGIDIQTKMSNRIPVSLIDIAVAVNVIVIVIVIQYYVLLEIIEFRTLWLGLNIEPV